jgi:hypothetical protein
LNDYRKGEKYIVHWVEDIKMKQFRCLLRQQSITATYDRRS